jgi:hypothetical protein
LIIDINHLTGSILASISKEYLICDHFNNHKKSVLHQQEWNNYSD